jgi:hypothetical protein
MSIRRLNFTGRKRIRQVDAQLSLEQDQDNHRFHADLRLDGYDLPTNALVFVEAYRQTSWMRFCFGTVGEIRAWDEPVLTEFGSCEGVLFRVRVTSTSSPRGLLLAEADKLRPRRPEREDEDRFPLLPARPDESLGNEIYRLDFDDYPMLLINQRVGDWQALTQDATFQALVLPGVLRETLTRILHIERYVEMEDPDDWRSLWLRFASRLPGVNERPREQEPERFDDWINDAVASFSKKFETLRRFKGYWSGESEA